ncbi:MAG: BolA family transcriptional regulator [Salinisphaera sp.]|jgi:acid stress-induced BolA-like protein IbaG/YrbA|nr:BolA family transcriptional regulator [Salinisphaera sp.]
MYSADAIRELIEAGLPDASVQVMGDDGQHFAARIVSPSFTGKGIIEQHRMVYATLGERMGGEIHALSLKTLTPEQADAAAS